MKKVITIVLCVLITPFASCQKKNMENMNKKIDFSGDYILNEKESKTGYYLQINNQNCNYKVLVNDLLSEEYNDVYPMYSTRTMLNYEILKSGNQDIKVIILPREGSNTLSQKASLDIKLLKYANMNDVDGGFGGSVELMSWALPNVDFLSELPFYEYEFSFDATVPYEMNTIDYAVDLREIDKDKLLEEVVEMFNLLYNYIENDYDQFNNYASENLYSSYVPIYGSLEVEKNVLIENKEVIEDDKMKKLLQSLKDYRLVLYGYGRIATLERLKDRGNVIWWKETKTGLEQLSLPLFIYKDRRDGEWHMW